jgi:hypothetical protein
MSAHIRTFLSELWMDVGMSRPSMPEYLVVRKTLSRGNSRSALPASTSFR